jgi:ribose/xylose/arabinose/galactoside ABC-type transport system permease subunit
MTFPPLSIGSVVAICVLVLCVVLAVIQGPTVILGLIAALAVARLT